ncbi:hypothetical protein LguiB_029207 [Lonicera macranthoides]
MACWSAENATNAYLKTMKMGKSAKEPDVAEFISALAAGNNSQHMVVASATTGGTTTLGLVAAAHQTGGHIVCIVHSLDELRFCQKALGFSAVRVEFVIGEARDLLLNQYWEADLVVVDCNLENYEEVARAFEGIERCNSSVVLGYNAFCKDSWRWSGLGTQLLPIGEGLLLTRIGKRTTTSGSNNCGSGKKSKWVVKVDRCTGEEHVFRVRSPGSRFIKA